MNQNDSSTGKPTRLLSLDVMRGLTILAMILVNNPGSWGALYWPLGHADWHGWTPTDLIFPFFLFMVGVAMTFSFKKYTTGAEGLSAAVWWRIVRRVFMLLLLGLLLSWSGNFWNLILGKSFDLGFDTLRWPGVLQRIALAYLGASLIVLLLGDGKRVAATVALLVGYWAMLALLPANVPPSERLTAESNIVRTIDVAVIGKQHMWTRATSKPTDPEGLLSTLPSIATVLLGYGAGLLVRGKAASLSLCGSLLFRGAVLTVVGAGLARWTEGSLFWMPINKALWTPTFVLLSGGLAMITLAACLLVFDLWGAKSKRLRGVATALEMVGVNAIFVFVASGLVARLLTILRVGDDTLKGWVYQNLCVAPLQSIGLTDPRLWSVVYAAGFVACWWLVLWGMWRKGWSIRV